MTMSRRWRARARRTAAVALLATSVSGCTLLLVSTDGLSGGADGGAETSAPPIDADLDRNLVAVDGASGDDASKEFCASNPGHTFCDDFDDRADVTATWTKERGGRGELATDTTRSRSAPQSFLASTAAGAQTISYAFITRDVGPTNRVRFAFDVFVTKPPGDVGDSFGSINFPNGMYLDLLWFTSGAFSIMERGGGENIDLAATRMFPAGQWVRVQVESTPGRILATLDGVTAIDRVTTRIYSGAATVSVGLYSEDAYAIGFNYDNVVVDTTF